MTDVTIQCPHCYAGLVSNAELDGQKVRCPQCGNSFVAHEPADDVASSGANIKGRPVETVSRTMLLPLAGLHHAPDGALICRLEPETLVWLDISNAAREFLGENLGSPGYESLLDVVHPDDQALAAEEFRRATEVGERHDMVLRVKAADDGWHFVRVDAQARYDRAGRLNHVRCHFIDVTDRMQEDQELRRRTAQLTAANEQLREANARLRETQAQLVHSEKLASLGTLAAGMAHEINNPLGFATSNTAVLERDAAALLEIIAAYQEGRGAIAAADPALAERIDALERKADVGYVQENMVELARSTRRGLQRVARIVADLREFARLDRSDLTEIDPNESLDQAVALLGEQFARRHVGVVRSYAANLPRVECAAASINQVLFHLLINAAQAIEDGRKGSGTIRLTTRSDGKGVTIEVADDGCGIPAENLPRIFDPFFTTKPVGRGTGLGLSISHGIIAEHGGGIDVDSEPGRGSTFRVRLPTKRPKS